MRRMGLDQQFSLQVTPDNFTGRREYYFDGFKVQEFIAIDTRTWEIQALTMMGEAGGAFRGQCNEAIREAEQ